MFDRLGFSFRVISSSHSVDQVRRAILHFIQTTALTVISEISLDQFRSYAAAVVTQLRTEPTDINESADPFWTEIADNRYCFQRTREQLRIIPSLSSEDVLHFYKQHFVGDVGVKEHPSELEVILGDGVSVVVVEASHSNVH